MRFWICIFISVLFFQNGLVFAQANRKVVVLNMNTYNQETNNSRYHACVNMLQLAGIPYDTTSFLDSVLNYPVVITASRITDTAFTTLQQNTLKNYVNAGGVLISSSLRDTALFNLFGITASNSYNTLTQLTFDTLTHPEYFALVNDSMEVTVSIGDSDFVNFYTRTYTLSTAQSLASYENNECALATNTYGAGRTYLFGPDFRDISLRTQLNMDLEAQRVYSNGFEVSTDVFVFVLRNIIRQHISNSVYKYTSPGNSTSVLLITHDVDSYSSIDTMRHFSVYEDAIGVSAQYNITTRYMSDTWMSDYYAGNEPRIDSLLMHGHVLASHSVGHFPDFDEEEVFPYGATGNTMISYSPAYTGGVTAAGTILGELEVSKDLLQTTYGVPIRSFRAGHLCYPDSLIMGMAETGYEFNSTNSANDILTGFPFFTYNRRSFSGEQNGVLEVPMTISDVFKDNPIADTNSFLKVHIWITQIEKYDANNCPVTLLIHPNRMFKLEALKRLLDSIPASMIVYPFQKYGEFWRKRDSLQYHTVRSNDTLHVVMDNNKLDIDQSFVVDWTGLDTVLFYDYVGNSLAFSHLPYSVTQRLYYRNPYLSVAEKPKHKQNSIPVFPNPTTDWFTIYIEELEQPGRLEVYNIIGKCIYSESIEQKGMRKVLLSRYTNAGGVYLVKCTLNNTVYTNKITLVK